MDFPHPGTRRISRTHIYVLTQLVAAVMSSFPTAGRQKEWRSSQHRTCISSESRHSTGGAAPSPQGGRGTRIFTSDLIPAVLSNEAMLDMTPSVNFLIEIAVFIGQNG